MAIWIYPQVPLLQQDIIGNNNNYYPNKQSGFVIGLNTAVNNTIADLWEGPTGTYVFPTSEIQMRVVSTSANDASAGTGARTVMIVYLDSSFAPHTETITLNGTTAVNTVATNIYRINEFHVMTAGSGGVSAGNISLQNTAGTVTYGYISAGYNLSRQAIFTIPSGKTGYLTHAQGSSGTSSGAHFTRIQIKATAHQGELLSGIFMEQDEIGTLNSGSVANYPIPLKFPAGCDIKMSAISDSGAANAIVSGALFGWYE